MVMYEAHTWLEMHVSNDMVSPINKLHRKKNRILTRKKNQNMYIKISKLNFNL
jgi:hypothetical protein